MAAKLVKATETINVTRLGTLIYGTPGSRKTSAAQTAERPFTLAFDPGIYRAFGRKDCAMFEAWQDVADLVRGHGDEELVSAFHGCKTVVLDTVSAGMNLLAESLIRENAKNGNRNGGLSLAGYGVLAGQFGAFVNAIRSTGKDLLMIAQEDSEKVGDETYYSPAFVGQKFYNTAMEYADLVGYMHFDNGKRVIDFAPSDRWFAKAPPCGIGQVTLPDFKTEPQFLGKIIAEAKASMGRVSEESAKVAAEVDVWVKYLDPEVINLDKLNVEVLDKFRAIPKTDPIRPQVWGLILAFAAKFDCVFDGDKKVFVQKQ